MRPARPAVPTGAIYRRDTAAPGSSSAEHGGGKDGSKDSAKGNAADVTFLTGMRPHHEQAVEMSEIVLAADPPAEVAAVARQIKDAQSPEIEQMVQMLEALGEKTDGQYEPALALAEQIKAAQAEEIVTMKDLLAGL